MLMYNRFTLALTLALHTQIMLTWISPRNCQADSLDLAEILLERYVAQADTQVLTPLFFTHTESEQQA